jgi:hypothetical protein
MGFSGEDYSHPLTPRYPNLRWLRLRTSAVTYCFASGHRQNTRTVIRARALASISGSHFEVESDRRDRATACNKGVSSESQYSQVCPPGVSRYS